MKKKSFERFAESAMRSTRDAFADPLTRARWKLAILYFLAGSFIFLFIGIGIDHFARETIRDVVMWETGEPVEQALRLVQVQLWVGRVVMFLLFALAAFALAEFSLRSIRQSIERQRRFVANVSHELRTPLAVMRAALDVALRKGKVGRLSPEDGMRAIRGSLSEIDRLSNIIDFLLVFADLDNRRKSLVMKPVDLAKVAGRLAGLMQGEAAGKNISLVLDAPPGALVFGNETALEEMVINLLKNALNYTESGGRVTMRVRRSEKNVRLIVSDTGVGISEQDLPRIFEPYYRGAEGRGGGGIGLGLSIVQEIAQLHGASISVSSVLGKGAEFTADFKEYQAS